MRLRIGSIAQHFGVTPQTLRNWEKCGRIPRAPRTRTGYRVYRLEDLPALERAAYAFARAQS